MIISDKLLNTHQHPKCHNTVVHHQIVFQYNRILNTAISSSLQCPTWLSKTKWYAILLFRFFYLTAEIQEAIQHFYKPLEHFHLTLHTRLKCPTKLPSTLYGTVSDGPSFQTIFPKPKTHFSMNQSWFSKLFYWHMHSINHNDCCGVCEGFRY